VGTPVAERRLAAILSADIAGYSRLIGADEEGTVRTLSAWREQVSTLVREHRGRVADFTGDNFLAEFPTALDAVSCALETQRVLEARNVALPEDRRLRFRMGVHFGDVRVEGERLFGTGVNVAARLQALAEPGGICLSDGVRSEVATKLGIAVEDLGSRELKNLPEPVHAFRVLAAGGAAPGSEPVRPDLGPQRLGRSKAEEATSGAVARPRRWRVVMLGLAFLAFGLAAGVASWLTRGASMPPALDNPLTNGRFTRFTDFEGTELDAAISPDGRFVAFIADRAGPFQVWVSQIGTGRFTYLAPFSTDEKTQLRGIGFSGDGAAIWIGGMFDRRLQLVPLSGGPPRAFLGERVMNVAWSADGTRLVYHTSDAGDPMFVADGDGANAQQIFVAEPGVHNHFPVWSPDGRWIYFTQGHPGTLEMDLFRIAPTGGLPERLTEHNGDLGYPAPIDARTVFYVARAEDRSGPWLWALDVERKITRRVTFGLERYTSLSASADGRRLVAAIANPSANLWSVPILDRLAGEGDVKPYPVPAVRAWAPRFGGESLFFLSSRGTGDGLWSLRDGQAFEIWKGAEGALLEPPAISRDGRRAAVVLRKRGTLRLSLVSTDGAERQSVAEAIDVRGTSAWSPDAKWIVTGGIDSRGAGLFKVPVDGSTPIRLVDGPAFNPVWSPDASLIVYAGQQVGFFRPLLAVRPDGSPVELPSIQVLDGERCRFLPDGKGLVYQGPLDFWLLDLISNETKQLTRLPSPSSTRTFDVTPDGSQIIFDRLRENSDIVLIELPKT
jgi:class 3 adenylate cyclase/Tol biopolymer transport system component